MSQAAPAQEQQHGCGRATEQRGEKARLLARKHACKTAGQRSNGRVGQKKAARGSEELGETAQTCGAEDRQSRGAFSQVSQQRKKAAHGPECQADAQHSQRL